MNVVLLRIFVNTSKRSGTCRTFFDMGPTALLPLRR